MLKAWSVLTPLATINFLHLTAPIFCNFVVFFLS